MIPTLYGIRNCDTVTKARARLDARGISYGFHDYKIAGIASGKLDEWIGVVGWETLLNRAGTTFRKLPEADKADLDPAKAKALMLEHPSMIRRPVVETAHGLLIGFKPAEWEAAGL